MIHAKSIAEDDETDFLFVEQSNFALYLLNFGVFLGFRAFSQSAIEIKSISKLCLQQLSLFGFTNPNQHICVDFARERKVFKSIPKKLFLGCFNLNSNPFTRRSDWELQSRLAFSAENASEFFPFVHPSQLIVPSEGISDAKKDASSREGELAHACWPFSKI